MPLLQTETREISGRTYTIRVLALAEARPAYAKAQRILALASDDNVRAAGMGAAMFAHMTGGLPESDLDALSKLFGPTTMVDMGDGRVLQLGGRDGDSTQSELFSGAIEDFFAWLDACVEINFKGVIEKMRGASAKLGEKKPAAAPGA